MLRICIFLGAIVMALGMIKTKRLAEGKFKPGKIYGGKEIEIENAPYQVSMRVHGMHICGGSIVTTDIVLTAAHCLEGIPSSNIVTVQVGSKDNTRGGNTHTVAKMLKHPFFQLKYGEFDAALLKVNPPFNITVKNIETITMSEYDPQPGDKIFVSGWGATETHPNGDYSKLKGVELTVISLGDCRNKYGENYTLALKTTMFCAGSEVDGQDACQGDSGGPAVYEGNLVGIVSWGAGCGNSQYPGVYTKVKDVSKWVNYAIKHDLTY